MPEYDEHHHPCRRHNDRLDNLETKDLKLEARMDTIEGRMQSYEVAVKDIVSAIRDLTEQLKHLAPLGETYQDVRGAFKIISWLVSNAKTIAVIGVGYALVTNSPTILKLLGL